MMVWDKSELLQRIMNNEEIIPVLLNAFIDDAPKCLSQLKEAVDQGDMELVNRQAHTIKGMAANLAAQPLTEIAYTMETAAKENRTDDLPELVSELNTRLDAVMERFKEELSS